MPYQQASEETITKGADDVREVVMMINAQTKETAALKQCPACNWELLERDRFCRHCGANQDDSCVTEALSSDLSGYATKPLRENAATYQSLSGALINILARDISAKSFSYCASRGLTRLIAVIAAIPIWLLIVLLAPVEAYSAAKTITKRL